MSEFFNYELKQSLIQDISGNVWVNKDLLDQMDYFVDIIIGKLGLPPDKDAINSFSLLINDLLLKRGFNEDNKH